MNVQESLKRYCYFHSELMKLGNFPLNERATVKELKLSRGAIQYSYNLMKKLNFKDSIIDFMCMVSLQFVQYNWLLGAAIISERRIDPLVIFNNEEARLRFYLIELAESCLRLKVDAKNMLRLTFSNPHYFFESDFYKEFRNKFQKHDEADLSALCFRVISNMYYSYSFKQDDFAIADSVRKELKSLSKQKLSPCNEVTAKKVLTLLPREKQVLQGVVEYLTEVGGNRIRSIKNTLSKHFFSRQFKISDATIFHAVKGLTEIGLLKVVKVEELATSKRGVFVYEFNKELFENSEILVQGGLLRNLVSESLRVKKRGKIDKTLRRK